MTPEPREGGPREGRPRDGRPREASPGEEEVSEPLLEIDGLTITFPLARGPATVVRDVSVTVGRGEIVALVGESGAGKSLTAQAVLGLVPPPGRITGGQIRLGGKDLLRLSPAELTPVRGQRVAMVFQEPTTALNPVFSIGFQITEVLRQRHPLSRRQARQEAIRLLGSVAMPDPASRVDAYPHELSGGQCQRALLAMALAGEPELLLADEPTTALDVTVQAQILALLRDLRQRLGLAILFITHNLGVVAQICDRVVVLYAGEVVEEAPVETLFAAPAHPYTRALLATSPRLGSSRDPGDDSLETASRFRLLPIPGAPPDPSALPPGCAFAPRCREAFGPCAGSSPELCALPSDAPGNGSGLHRARCFLYREVPP